MIIITDSLVSQKYKLLMGFSAEYSVHIKNNKCITLLIVKSYHSECKHYESK